jgi:16S rRNA (cytosine1402-N4)-methyltransferase
MNIISNNHKSVLAETIKDYALKSNSSDNIFDGTFGGGGYTDIFLTQGCNVYACDLDDEAILYYKKNKPINRKLTLTNNNFADYIEEFVDNFFSIIVADLGYSSNQLEFGKRGFSYLKTEEVFDLRYDTKNDIPVYEKIKKLKESSELGRIIFRYSGETFSNRISQAIYSFIISSDEVVYTYQIVKLVEEAIPKKFLHKKNSILSRVWQALRVWVNKEFDSLEVFLTCSLNKLKPEGLLIITSFNSLEDKIVTQFMRRVSQKIIIDDYGNTEQNYEIITKKAIVPSKIEVEENIRSRSALLRVLKKL